MSKQESTVSARKEIAEELATAQAALTRATEIDAETDALGRAERENITVPMGRLSTVQNSLPDPAEAPTE